MGTPDRDTRITERALKIVASFHGDPRCSLNVVHAEALAAEIASLRQRVETLADHSAEIEKRKAAEARVRELEAENTRLDKALRQYYGRAYDIND